jgi:REP element-mobilizing transposase RayT
MLRFGMDDGIHRRHGAHLPHWTRQGEIYFVTFRLWDSLPQSVLREYHEELREEINRREAFVGRVLNQEETSAVRRKLLGRVERFLDAGQGSCVLSNPVAAEIVQRALGFFQGQRYLLHAWSVMPNHVHAVLTPCEGYGLSTILHSWKSYTSHRINAALHRQGHLWQQEYFDHLIRGPNGFDRFVRYTLENPTKAGLQDWPWVGSM